MELLIFTGIAGLIWLASRLVRSAHAPPKHPTALREPSAAEPRPMPKPSPEPLKGSRWIPYGTEIDVQGIRIAGGMLYVGTSLPQIRGGGIEPALIDSRLPIAPHGTGDDMPYWPSYSTISPAARGAYLRWLAGGRSDPNAVIGLVFLFLYGLERRALYEKKNVPEHEWGQILSDVGRLLEIYGSNRSFRKYASGFLSILSIPNTDPKVLIQTAPVVTGPYDSPNLPLRMGLGWMATDERPIPACWALAWVRASDGFYERTPATRCRAEFERLFAFRYHERFGNGLVIKPNKTPLRASYRPASASFSDDIRVTIPEVPDVTVLKQPVDKLVALANACTDELDPYSRFLGRNPTSDGTPAAMALLPAPLLSVSGHATLERVAAWISRLDFSDGLAVTRYSDLQSAWSSLPQSSSTKRDAVVLAQCLGHIGYGLEPDVRFGAHQLRTDGRLVLFPLAQGAPVAPSPSYATSTLLAHLGAVMAHADNQVTPEEEQALMLHASQNLDLTEPERTRLRAYMKWLLIDPPETTGLKKRIEALQADQRSFLASFLASLVSADSHISPAEVTALQKAYRMLGLDPSSVFADTHAAASEPVTVQTGERTGGYGIPMRRSEKDKRINLDRVRAIQLESEQVSVLLRDIFTEEAEITTTSVVGDAPVIVKVRVMDLDDAHSAFAVALMQRDSWSRGELGEVASRYGLLPDGAIDALNEAALNTHGEPLVEGDDPMEVNTQLRSVLQP